MKRVTLIGRLTNNIELKEIQTQNGTMQIAEFGIAINPKSKKSKEEVLFMDCKVFGKQAEILNQYVEKGKRIAVEGDLVNESWTKQDGTKQSKIRVVVRDFEIIDFIEVEKSAQNEGAPEYQEPKFDEIPF